MAAVPDQSDPLRARVPADVDAPDRILGELTARQVAVLAVAAAAGYLAWRTLHTRLPTMVLLAAAVPLAGAALAVAVGRRDGLPLEVWLAHAVRFRRAPRRLLPAPTLPPPAWGPAPPPRAPVPAVLRLPTDAIGPDGTVRLTPHRTRGRARASACLVGVTTVPLTARTSGEQAGLVAGFAGWLNGLTGPAQVVISQRRVDLTGHAARVADTVHLTGSPALAAAGQDYADFLLDLAERTEPLARTVIVAATATGPDADATARRAGEHTATSLSGLGAHAAVLDGPAVTAAVTAAVDPYQPGDAAWPRAVPGQPVTRHRPDPLNDPHDSTEGEEQS